MPYTARRNRGRPFIDPDVSLDDRSLQEGIRAYNAWHWGAPTKFVSSWDDDDYPEMLISCGRLIRLHIRAPKKGNRHPRRERDTMIELSRNMSDTSFVAYDPNHPNDRLYFCLDPRTRPALKRQCWNENRIAALNLNDAARIAGGLHGQRRDYPDIMVKPVGVLTAVLYFTHKVGDENENDDRSFYIHSIAEVSYVYPFLCIDKQGRAWLAGGNGTAPTAGLTD